MPTQISRRAIMGVAAALTVLATGAVAQDFPNRPITLITPVAAGGGTDTNARAIAASLAEVLGVPVNVVNRPGAGGFAGARDVATSLPDGHTLMVQSYGTFMLNALSADQPVHPLDDFVVLGMIGELYTGLAVRKDDARFATVEDFVAFAKANPDFTYGFSGNGSWHHAAAVATGNGLGYTGRAVSFDSGGKVRASLLGGQVDVAWMGTQQISGFEEQLKFLFVNKEERYPLTADVPTLAEIGLPYTLVTSPIVVAAPKGTDLTITQQLEAAIAEAAQSASYVETMEAALALAEYKSASETSTYLQGLYEAWGPVAELTE